MRPERRSNEAPPPVDTCDTRLEIENFAAATDVFARIEARSGSAVVGEGRVHVRTTGGPLAELSTVVREVHLFAPNIVQVVLENKEVHSFSDRNDLHDDGVDEIIGYTGETSSCMIIFF